MPDWTYQTVFRPILFRLPVLTGRNLALRAMGALARFPGGHRIIEFMGHMRPPAGLSRTLQGVTFRTPVGLAPGIDPQLHGLPALARFGFGFVEVGPVTLSAVVEAAVVRDPQRQAIRLESALANPGLEQVCRRLQPLRRLDLPIIVRLGRPLHQTPGEATQQCGRVCEQIADWTAMFSVPMPTAEETFWNEADWRQHVRSIRQSGGRRPLVIAVPANGSLEHALQFVAPALAEGACGVIVSAATDGERCELGSASHAPAVELTQRMRKQFGAELLVIASGGVHQPADAERFWEAGADLVQVDSGLIYTGPGLPKRINEAAWHRESRKSRAAGNGTSRLPAARYAWFWTLMMAISMLGGGGLALLIAMTRVVLPYDEDMVGMSRDAIAAVNPRLLDFMAHDRVTLAGTMLCVGTMYLALSWWGVRNGHHWARQAVVISAFAGFFSFFSFLGFGYFDPFHAFVTSVLFQFLLLALAMRLPTLKLSGPPDLQNDWRWRWSQWGQLLFVAHGAIVLAAGCVISVVGMTSVFVPTDLEFMQTTAEELHAVPRLVPLVAHDRATFGGMLISSGIVVLLASLWGYRRGAAWLWWALQIAGLFAYLATIGVHWSVGYLHMEHLLPAYGGLALLELGSLLSYPYLVGSRMRADQGVSSAASSHAA
jgi:dihydroorotate dehydrogenase